MSKKQHTEWQEMKKKMIIGLDCVLCGKPAQTLHHFKPKSKYPTPKSYFTDETQVPVCHGCHTTKLHILPFGKYRTEMIDGNPVNIKLYKCVGGGFD